MPKKNDDLNEPTQEEFDSPSNFCYYKSLLLGLAVRVAENEDRDITGVEKVRFVPYEFTDDKRGEKYRLGLLSTDEPEAVEILEDDHNVIKIDEDEYNKLVETGKRVPY